MGQNVSLLAPNQAANTCLCNPNGPGSLLEHRVVDPFLTLLWSPNSPFSRHFGILHGPKRINTGSHLAKKSVFGYPKLRIITYAKRVFDPFLTHVWSQNGPFSGHLEFSLAHDVSPQAQNRLKTLV